jgi:hypothetical protein
VSTSIKADALAMLIDGQSVARATNLFHALATLSMLGSTALIRFAMKPKGPLCGFPLIDCVRVHGA